MRRPLVASTAQGVRPEVVWGKTSTRGPGEPLVGRVDKGDLKSQGQTQQLHVFIPHGAL